MFEAGIPLAYQSGIARGRRSRLRRVARGRRKNLRARAPAQTRPPALMVALHIWAMSHGIASLFGRGDAARRTLPMSPEELLEAQVLVYLRGLGVPKQKSAAGPSGPARIPKWRTEPHPLHEVERLLTRQERRCKCYLHSHLGGLVMVLVDKLDELGRPAWIALTILGFMAWWPIGLAVLAFFIGSGRMGCWHHSRRRTVATPHGPLAIEDGAHAGENGPHAHQDGRRAAAATGGAPRHRAATAPSTIIAPKRCARLEDEQREFKEFLERLRFAKDRAEFDQFMADAAIVRQDASPQPQPQT